MRDEQSAGGYALASSSAVEAPAVVPGHMTVADLSVEHHGWLLKVADPDPVLRYRTFVLGKGFGCGVRRWTAPDGAEMVGLTDDERDGPFIGTERIYPASTPVELVRQIKRARRRRG